MLIRTAALSDIGKLRRKNEDRFLCDDALRLYAVADGIGGLPGGADAAQCAIDQLHAAITAALPGSLPDLTAITEHINNAVRELSVRLHHAHGMGTTLTYALLRDDHLCLAHIGDSRCYLMREGELICLTTDHTVENDTFRRLAHGEKILFYEESQRHALTRCIGQIEPPEVDTLRHKLRAGDRYLLCSDGINKMIPPDEIAALMIAQDEPRQIVRDLVDRANAHGGADNATTIVITIDALS